uniref:Uncharacterized protein n=1 Tax=Rhizophora mucronata TaxID=61149 RepID=A0A2P2MZD9_RHIMU
MPWISVFDSQLSCILLAFLSSKCMFHMEFQVPSSCWSSQS